jgi:hypothetical protein
MSKTNTKSVHSIAIETQQDGPHHSKNKSPERTTNNYTVGTMSNLIDADAGTERFSGYEAELKLVQADLNQQLEQIKETTGEPRKAAISKAERALEEAEELVRRSADARKRQLKVY